MVKTTREAAFTIYEEGGYTLEMTVRSDGNLEVVVCGIAEDGEHWGSAKVVVSTDLTLKLLTSIRAQAEED